MKPQSSSKKIETQSVVMKGMQMHGHGSRFKETQKPKSIKRTLASLWQYLQHERLVLMAVVGLVILQTLASLIAPLYIGIWIDVMGKSLMTGIVDDYSALAVIAFSYVVSAVSQWLQNFLVAGSSQRIVLRVRTDLFEKMTRQSMPFYDTRSHGDLMSRFINDVEQVSTAINETLIQLIAGVLTISGALAMMLSIHLILTVVALGMIPLVFILTGTITRKTRPLFKKQQQSMGALNGLIEETLDGLHVIQAFNRENQLKSTYEALNETLYASGKSAQLWTGLLMPMMNVINNLSYAMIGFTGGVLILKGQLTVGRLTSFINYSRYLIRPINEIASTYASFMSALAGAERVFEILELEDEEIPKGLYALSSENEGRIAFENINFSYTSQTQVLKDIEFQVEPGRKIALVGPTGAGKTTIASLLARFYAPTGGRILLDGADIRHYDIESLSRGFGIVLQDTYLFEDTILNNIRYGRLEASDEEVIEAARKANAHQFIRKLPLGYLQLLSTGGDNLSIGEKQLITIARALLADPLILILDEATSSVDTRTEKAVQKALFQLMKHRTSFIIAHRLSTIRDADEILFIQDGYIKERGTHEDLMGLKGHYYAQYMHQYQGFEE